MNTRIIIDRLSERDLPDVAAIVRHWVRRDGEVIEEEAAAAMATIGAGLNRASGSHYLVAREDPHVVLGVMGFGILNAKLVPYKTNPEGNAVGLLTAFLSPAARGGGLGGKLLTSLFAAAGAAGAAEMIWSSNPRYRNTAWQFYTRMAGIPVGTVSDLFYPGSVSPVWRQAL
ncbi:MAG TPA: GNAT family N-acetyltransferase [Syntrophales bacterium]|jgi:L-amino acid N-acyltransferase YncA|nr:GNAT family N-acetyltransferase [Syntrophales bacterium]HOU76956.1 GNAT family N-acetyltransferase [Syntrophales bacterium]HPC31725.1 GNAT family N-acetyltransferase [Syntrophales bacterium]HQG34941.1 GNAT family N-acetyltransferase [Syntrophales bacterium]HQI36856.1 GNAT family N-acetyltransferase [Syntrophales bacterium]